MIETNTSETLEAGEVRELTSLSEQVAEDDLPSTGLLSFYDRLRKRIKKFGEKKGGRLTPKALNALLLIPDVFVLLMRLALDKNVPKESRALIGGALAYFVLPVDLVPEALAGPIGYSDDLFLALAVLSQAFGRDLEAYTAKYWNGSESLRVLTSDVLTAGHGLIGIDLHGRLKTVLADRGVDLDKVQTEAAD